MKAIVLSGGGSKGAYEIGVWKALRKLHIHYDIVTGTSVGALNAVFMVQKDYKKAEKLWKQLNYDLLFSESIDEKKLQKQGNFYLLKAYLKEILSSGGMDVSKLNETIQKNLSLQKFYQSKIDFGMITVHLDNLKPICLTKKEIKKEELHDYLMASAACFPAFQMKKIEGSHFIDGGYYDNLPINLAISMGADEIIAVDLQAIGRKQKVKNNQVPITYIIPRNEIGNFLVFNKEQSIKAIQYGYHDTLKAFGKLDGNLYTFRKNHLKIHHILYSKKWRKMISSITSIKEYSELEVLELLGKTFELEEYPLYSIFSFRKRIKSSYKKENKKIREWWSQKSIILNFAFLIENKDFEKVKKRMKEFPLEFLAASYLVSLH